MSHSPAPDSPAPDSPAADPRASGAMIPFPHIYGFDRFLKEYADGGYAAGVVDVVGTVKLHGTHGAVVSRPDADLQVQSRNRVLAVDDDNAGFADFVSRRADAFRELIGEVRGIADAPRAAVVVSGEFCGGNLQKHVALTALPRMFVVFDVRVDGRHFALAAIAPLLAEERFVARDIHSVLRAAPFELTLDLTDVESCQRALDAVTDGVDASCPFAAALGAQGAGEGIVWRAREHPGRSRLWFKTKGKTHNPPSVKKLRAHRPPKQGDKEIAEYVRATVTERRLEQGLEYIGEMHVHDARHMVDFADWVLRDALREHDPADLDRTALKKAVRARAIPWYKRTLSSE